MKELLLAFILALIIGSIINGWQQQPSQPDQSSTASQTAEPRHDYPVTDSSFEQEVLKAELPVLVDFWAPWCGPCKAEAPIVEQLSQEYAGRLKVVKLNTDENPKTAQAYNITALPSLCIFKGGKVVEQIVGAAPRERLTIAIDRHVEARSMPGITANPPGPHRDFPDFNSFPNLNQYNFDDIVLNSEKPVFILCYSPNNLSYERMVPLIAALAQEHADSIKVARLNILENATLAQKFEVFVVPSYLVFSKRQLINKWTGIVAKDRLEAMIAAAKP
jgi:thioredoxin 1